MKSWVQSFSKFFITSAFLLFAVLLSSVSINLLNTSSVHAASVFDDTVQLTPTLSVLNGSCSPFDLSSKWEEIFLSDTGLFSDTSTTWTWDNPTNFDTKKANWNFRDRWGVSQSVSPAIGTSTNNNVYIWSSQNTATEGDFFDVIPGSYQLLNATDSTNTISSITITQNSTTCNIEVSGSSSSTAGSYTIADGGSLTDGGRMLLYFAYLDVINYPLGYDGSVIPDSPPGFFEATPDIEIISGESPYFIAQDNNFYTFDDPPFLCNDDLTPVIFWELWKGHDPETDVFFSDGSQSPTSQIITLLDPNEDYTFISWYDCDGNPVIDGQSRDEFTVTMEGYSDWIPDLNIVTANGWFLSIQDQHFNTFDPVPFTCNSETTPVMDFWLYETTTGSDVLIDSGTMSPTVQYARELDRRPATYRFVAKYDCGGYPDLIFAYNNSVNIELNQFGTLVRECSDDISGFFCSVGEGLQFGIFSQTFTGLADVIGTFQSIDPSACNGNWPLATNFESDILPVQDFPAELCAFAEANYLAPTSPFYQVTLWLNIVLSGSAVFLLVFGLLSLFGVKVRLSSPIAEEEDTGIHSEIPTHPSVSSHRGTYSKSPGGTRSTDVTFARGSSKGGHN